MKPSILLKLLAAAAFVALLIASRYFPGAAAVLRVTALLVLVAGAFGEKLPPRRR